MSRAHRLMRLLDDPGFYQLERRARAGPRGWEVEWRLGMVVEERLTWWLGPSLGAVVTAAGVTPQD